MEAELTDMSLNETKTPAHAGQAHGGSVTSLAVEVTSSQQLLVSGGQDFMIKVWNVFNNQLLCTLAGHSSSVRHLDLLGPV